MISLIFDFPSQKSSSQVPQCCSRPHLCYLNIHKWEGLWFQVPFTHMKLSATLWNILKCFSEHIASAPRAVPVIFPSFSVSSSQNIILCSLLVSAWAKWHCTEVIVMCCKAGGTSILGMCLDYWDNGKKKRFLVFQTWLMPCLTRFLIAWYCSVLGDAGIAVKWGAQWQTA